jgi:UDP-N-acetylglucosamine--N-acetylmuramyl-(pentapeptide) pyrophosphoryl-undecaprenol N-acetylglucosamine transferase
VKAAYGKWEVDAEVYEFHDKMEEFYTRADWVISRSGAMTVSELAAAGRPSLLIPYPFAVDDHQAKNARYLVDAKAAVMIRQERLTGEKIAEILVYAMSERDELSRMGMRAREAARPGAAGEIVDYLLKLIGEN